MKNLVLQAEGFGSLRDSFMFEFNKPGINLIRGANGSGKTTIINALIWNLYGTNLKNVNIDKLPTKEQYRTDDWRGTTVNVSFEKDGKGYFISRNIKYKGTLTIREKTYKLESSLFVFEDGNLVSELHQVDNQEFINKLIGINAKVFLNSILFGQSMVRFIQAKPVDKREIFESIFDFDWINEAKTKAGEKVNEITNTININKSSITIAENSIIYNNNLIESVLREKENFENDKKTNIEALINTNISSQNAIDNLKLEIEALTKKIKPVKDNLKLTNDLKEANQAVSTLNNDKLILINNLNKLKLDIQKNQIVINTTKEPQKERETCSVCGANLSPSKIMQLEEFYNNSMIKYKSLINNAISELETFNDEITNVEDELKTIEVDIESLKDYINILNIDNEKIDAERRSNYVLENKIQNYQSEIKVQENIISRNIDIINKLKDTKFDESTLEILKKTIEDNKLVISDATKNIEELSVSLCYYDWWFNTGFASKGLKGYIMDSTLESLNDAIFKYSQLLGFNIEFEIDTSKISKPFNTKIYVGNTEFIYEEFSGGEKARIDIATALAMHDVISMNVDVDFLIMDEVFEGLDDNGIDRISELIQLKAQDKSLFIISHLKDINFLNASVITVAKENNTTVYKR